MVYILYGNFPYTADKVLFLDHRVNSVSRIKQDKNINELVWYEPIIIILFLIIPHDITDILLKVALSIIIITLLLIILI